MMWLQKQDSFKQKFRTIDEDDTNWFICISETASFLLLYLWVLRIIRFIRNLIIHKACYRIPDLILCQLCQIVKEKCNSWSKYSVFDYKKLPIAIISFCLLEMSLWLWGYCILAWALPRGVVWDALVHFLSVSCKQTIFLEHSQWDWTTNFRYSKRLLMTPRLSFGVLTHLECNFQVLVHVLLSVYRAV